MFRYIIIIKDTNLMLLVQSIKGECMYFVCSLEQMISGTYKIHHKYLYLVLTTLGEKTGKKY